MKIGVISDTHDFLDPQIARLFAGVDHILHAGDVGLPQILLELEHIAPVTAVLGNTDHAVDLKLTEIVTLGDRKFLIQHIVNPHAPDEKLRTRLRRDRPDAVIFGHTHKLFNQTLDATWFFNPGYSGRPKFNTERSVAILHCTTGQIRAEYLML